MVESFVANRRYDQKPLSPEYRRENGFASTSTYHESLRSPSNRMFLNTKIRENKGILMNESCSIDSDGNEEEQILQ